MFTGIVEEMGVVSAVRKRGAGREITIKASVTLKGAKIGDSLAVDGCCQTIVSRGRGTVVVVAVEETLRKTTLGTYVVGRKVNLERPMRADSRFGGHFVLGHVDETTTVRKITGDDTARMYWFAMPKRSARLLIPVGSIAVNGVSLTVARITKDQFAIAIIPHTWEHTTFCDLKPGSVVNIEYDVLGKYVERIAGGRRR